MIILCFEPTYSPDTYLNSYSTCDIRPSICASPSVPGWSSEDYMNTMHVLAAVKMYNYLIGRCQEAEAIVAKGRNHENDTEALHEEL